MAGYENVVLNVFALLLLAIILGNMYRRSGEYLPDQKLFHVMIVLIGILIILDSCTWAVDGKPGKAIHYFSYFLNVLGYTLMILPCVYWCFYVRYQIKMDVKEMFKIKKLIIMPFYINTILAVLSCFYGFYFYIDEQNIYHRGELFWLGVFLMYAYYIYSMVYLIINRKNTENKIIMSLILFPLPPVLGSILQVMHYGIALFWPGAVLSIAIVYLNIQKNQLYTDHLTGLYNRRLLDIHLEDCLKNNIKPGGIGVIMIDIDKFKTINDTLGHMIGDQALMETANVLKKSVGKTGFIARYGGDEFVVIVPTKALTDIESIARDIDRNIETYNARDNALFKMHLSLGYEVFDCNGETSRNDIISHIDRQMYNQKFSSRVLENQMKIQ